MSAVIASVQAVLDWQLTDMQDVLLHVSDAKILAYAAILTAKGCLFEMQ